MMYFEAASWIKNEQYAWSKNIANQPDTKIEKSLLIELCIALVYEVNFT